MRFSTGLLLCAQVDAERAELDVLRGIRDEDWHKIRQLSLEVHDIACDDHDASLGTIGRASGAIRRVEVIVLVLKKHGFQTVVVEQSPRMHGTNLFMIYATRG